jgi:hypothetical protein
LKNYLERIALYGTLAGIPFLIAGYASTFQSVRSYLNTGQAFTEWLGGFAVIAIVVALTANAVAHTRLSRAPQANPGEAGPIQNPQLANIEALYRQNDGQFLREMEAALRNQMEQNHPPDREAYLLRGLVLWTVLSVHEITWLNIFASQLRALNQLNAAAMTYQEIRRFYDEGAANRPDAYENRPFESWLAFLRTFNLIVDNGTNVQITVRGRDFLRYIVQSGYNQNSRIA